MRLNHSLLAASAILMLGLAVPPADAQEAVLHGFAGGADGVSPEAGLIADASGNLYGTTDTGGTSNAGTVFRLAPPAVAGGAWTNTVLYSFQGGADGDFSQAPLLPGGGGILYGTTEQGGASGFGTVFALTPPAVGGTAWGKTILFAFTGGADGGYPYTGAGLIIDTKGDLYGTTLRGGSKSDGTAFMLAPPAVAGMPWTETVLHSFTGGKDGYFPKAGLLAGAGGVLYGTTAGGGASFHCSGGCGTLFLLTPPLPGATKWTKTTLHSFGSGKDGSDPQSVLIADANGALYGTTYAGGGASACSFGCGTVFRLAPPVAAGAKWTATTLHAFQSGTDTEFPEAGLVADPGGALYGTAFGAYPNRLGAAFKLAPPVVAGATRWTETILHGFTGNPDGSNPAGGLLAGAGGVFYGTTEDGGGAGSGICGRGCGSVFQITP
jgi:uncharacterized repeat protein (TIGR03803 family)